MIMVRYGDNVMDIDNLSNEELKALVEKLMQENKNKDKRIAILEAEKRDLNIKFEEVIAKYENKLQANKKIIADRFGKKTEKLSQEFKVINEVEALEPKKRKAPTERFIEELKELQNEVIIFDYDFDGNGIDRANVKPFGVDESYKIEITPMAISVVKIERPKYKDKEHIYQALSNDPYPNSPLTPSLAANIIEMKYNLGIPLYRYAKYMNSYGINVSPQDLSNYVMRTMDKLEPLYNEFEKALVNTPYKVIHGDETPLEVIDSKKDKCYMFVYTTSFWDNVVYIYKFSETRKIDNTVTLLNNYSGYYECDGYPGYDALPDNVVGNIKIQRCWVHIRRYFYDCLKSISENKRKKSPAYNVVKKIDEMFNYEAMMREKHFTRDEIKEYRNGEDYQKTIKELDGMILAIDYGSNSYLKKAVNHYINDKDELYTFLEDGYIDISNNLAERTVKPFVIARKNFMFCKTADGATATGKLFSIVQTAKANGIKSELYLKYVIENIDKEAINNLLPWSKEIKEKLSI